MTVTTLLDPLTRGEVPQSHRGIPYRFRNTWAFKESKGQFFLGTFTPTDIPLDPTDHLYVVEAGDVGRPDVIAYKIYKTPELYWVILWINSISDPFEGIFVGMTLRLPTLIRLMKFGLVR